MHKLHELGFDLNRIERGFGGACPVHRADDRAKHQVEFAGLGERALGLVELVDQNLVQTKIGDKGKLVGLVQVRIRVGGKHQPVGRLVALGHGTVRLGTRSPPLIKRSEVCITMLPSEKMRRKNGWSSL